VINLTYWITENLGVINLSESMTEEGVIIVDVRDLSDVEKNVDKVVKKIIIIGNLLCSGERVAVRCIAGINRSCGIALGVMMYMGNKKNDVDWTYDYHFDWLKRRVGRCMITPQFERTIKLALRKLDGRYTK